MSEDTDSELILKPGAVEKHKADLDFLWGQSVRLNANLFLFKRIRGFDFELFGDGAYHCWGLFGDALYEACNLAVWRLAVEPKHDVLSLRTLRDWMLKNCKSPSARGELMTRVGVLATSKLDKGLVTRLTEFRHHWLAHLGKIETILERTSGLFTSESELQTCCDAIHADITNLCLEGSKLQTYEQYMPDALRGEGAKQRDIDRLLDLVALNSAVYRMPEEQPAFWPHYRTTLGPHKLRRLEDYREKLGRPSFVLTHFTPVPQ